MRTVEKVVQKLISKGYHISFSESCTGGLAAATLVSVSDASKVFNESFVTYANAAKVHYLGVNQKTIDTFGVVSEEVAKEMSVGTAKETNSEIAVGISGIAGPTGGTETKPVGMVCFGFYINGKVYTYTQYFGNIGRNKVRQKAVNFVYSTLNKLIK